jgi:uncharacterized protein
MQAPVLHQQHQQQFWLTGLKALFWQNAQALVVSDMHLGKTGHFRKNGIAVPTTILQHDLQKLTHLIIHFKPKCLFITGDFFHSIQNKETNYFLQWRADFQHLDIQLILGNHDILSVQWYQEANINVTSSFNLNNIVLVHNIADVQPLQPGNYYLSGHIHPGIVLKANSRQNLRLPCYYFGNQYAILPAFGGFTGLHTIKPKKEDCVFAIADEKVMQLK